MSTDAQGNLAQFFDAIGAGSSDIMNIVGTALGALADIAGAVGAVEAVVSFVEGFFGSGGAGSDLDQKFTDLSNTITSGFQQLGYDSGSNQTLTSNSYIWSQVNPAFTWFQDISLSSIANLKMSDKEGQIHDCGVALNAFINPQQPDQVWYRTYDWVPFWNDQGIYQTLHYLPAVKLAPVDAGYGEQAPARADDVFAYDYSLPCFLLAITWYIAVATALAFDFPANSTYQIQLAAAAETLQSKHDQILSGITRLMPPPPNPTVPAPGYPQPYWTTNNISYWSVDVGLPPVSHRNTPGIRSAVSDNPPYVDIPGAPVANEGGVIEYGAVETYSGYSIIENSYYIYANPPDDSIDPANKLALRALRKAKQVYVNIGLLSAWNTINKLHSLTGQASLSRPNFADWSFRNEVIPQIMNSAVPQSPQAPWLGEFSLTKVAHFMINAVPADTQASKPGQFTWSFQDLLSGQDFPLRPTDY
jgi:hypothetical protein